MQKIRNILVSACLLGVNCRYNGVPKSSPQVLKLLEREDIQLIPICPEQLGGLPTPRYPSEIMNSSGCVMNKIGEDVTANYVCGAEETLKLARLYKCTCAILKERSPSCGAGEIYDGTFSKTLISGDGVTARLLKENGISILGESQL